MDTEAVTYYTRDSLKNFYIKAELRKLSSSRNTNALLQDLRGHSIRIGTPAGDQGSTQECEEWTFKWQKKIFSQHEEEVYADANNCINTLEEQYHRDILELRKRGGRANRRLFSYLDKDGYKNPVTLVNPPITDSSFDDQTFASKHASTVRRRNIPRINRGLNSTVITNPVSYKPSNYERISHRVTLPPSQTMFIMADLRQMDGVDPTDEHVLCHITIDARGMVTVKPDFNKGKPAYRIKNRHREVFEYWLEHASTPISTEDRLKEEQILSELYSQHLSNLSISVGSSFMEPPGEGSLSVMMLGEIVSAKGFEYDHLYVTAHLELPEFWEIEDKDYSISPRSQLPVVITQICSKHKDDIAHFACPMEFSLLCHQPTSSEDSISKWPKILFEVASLDRWDRHRAEGYGYLDLPTSPGSYVLNVSTWRPIGKRIRDKLKRFFTGGPPEIDDITYVACSKDFSGTHLSRYGFRTETTGSVQFRLHLTHQSSKNAEKQVPQTKYNLKSTVAAVLETFQRAKDRAITLTTTLEKDQ